MKYSFIHYGESNEQKRENMKPRESSDLTAVIPRWSNYCRKYFHFTLYIFLYFLIFEPKQRKKNEPPDISVFAVSTDSSCYTHPDR